ncbi:MAG: hypothetical protein MRY21_00585 [Simkaniaceae bacterium]|nr:hypothetical protein [Simkaniaceae bacterium]
MMRYLLLLLIPVLPLLGQIEEDEFVVHLKAEHPISPVYIPAIQSSDQKLASLVRETLEYDFSTNGRCRIHSQTDTIDALIHRVNKQEAFNSDTWKHLSVEYVIKPVLTGKVLSTSLFCVKDGLLVRFKDVKLSDRTADNERSLHRLSDAIHEKMFGTPGIASTQILYAFHDGDEQWKSEIFLVDYNGKYPCSLTEENSYSISPVVVPNQHRIMYVCYKNGQPKIHQTGIGQSKGVPAIQLSGNQLLPTISPKGDMMAYICDASGRADLFIQNFDPEKGPVAKPIQLFSYPKSVQASPTFSPDGSKIAFVSDKGGNPQIYLIDLEKTAFGTNIPEVRQLINRTHESTSPAWSPDGKKLAYSAKTRGVRQIWIYDFESGKEFQLTKGPGHKENPAWAPNSLHLVYNTTSPTSELFVINLNQQTPVKITDGPGIKHYPYWAPVQ